MRRSRGVMFTECPACLGEWLGFGVTCERCGGTGKVSYAMFPRPRRLSRRQAEVVLWLFIICVIAVAVAAILLR